MMLTRTNVIEKREATYIVRWLLLQDAKDIPCKFRHPYEF